MTPEIERRITRIRRVLAADPSRVVAGSLNPAVAPPPTVWAPYADFLAVADGGRFGEVDLWSVAELPTNQWAAERMPGGVDTWITIGQVVYEPIGMQHDGSVTLFPDHQTPVVLGMLDEFLLRVTGDDYRTIYDGAGESPWCDILQIAGLT